MPTITFKINLTALNNYTAKQPYHMDTEANYFAATRSTWYPNQLLNNRQLKHGQTFTVSGAEAMYFYNNFTSGPYAFLSVVSTDGATTASFSSSSISYTSSSNSSSSKSLASSSSSSS